MNMELILDIVIFLPLLRRYDGGRRPQAGDKIDVFKQFVIDCYERQMFKSSTPFVPPERQSNVTPADSPIRSSPAPSARRSSGPSKNSGLVKATRSTTSTTPAVDLLDMGSPPPASGNASSAGNDDFFNQPLTAPADPFSTFSSSNTPQQQQQQQTAIFGGNDFFSQPVPTVMPQQQQDFFMQPQQPQQFEAFPQSVAPSTATTFNSFQPQRQEQQMPQSVFQIQTTRPTQDSDFGGFESAATPAKPKAEDKFSSFGGLVDLGNLTSKSEEEAKKQAAINSGASMNMNSFSGLDGFSRSPSSGSIMGISAMHNKPSSQQQPMMGLMSQQQQPPMMSNGMNTNVLMQPQPMIGGMGMMSPQPPMMNNGGIMSNGGMMNGGGMMNRGGVVNNGMQQNYAQQQPSMMGSMSNGMSVNTMNFMPSGSSMNNGSIPSPSSMKSQQYQQNIMMQQQKNNSFDGLRW